MMSRSGMMSGRSSGGAAFDSGSRWIWSGPTPRPYNNYVCFRRGVEVEGPCRRARLIVTADSRYELYVNGEWVGHGPPRSWKSPWPVDPYDIAHLLRPGRNVLAVLVHHIGLGTFQYLHAQAGLLAQLDSTDAAGAHRLATDGQWRAHVHQGYAFPVPRVSVTQGWEEQFDARQPPGLEWTGAGFDDSQWAVAQEVCGPGEGDHPRLEMRDIPMLTRKVVEPARLVSVEAVRPAPQSFSLLLKDFINPHDRTSNHPRGGLLVLSFVHSPCAQEVQLHLPHGLSGSRWKLNGHLLKFEDRPLQRTDTGLARARLRQGPNLLMVQLGRRAHILRLTVNAWTRRPVRLSAWREPEPGGQAAWRVLGPFQPPPADPNSWQDAYTVEPLDVHPDATLQHGQEIWDRGDVSESELSGPYSHAAGPALSAPVDVFALCASDRPAELPVRVEQPEALLHDNADWTVVHPPRRGADVRLLLDFGDEVVGYQEFELDAPAGTVIDGCGFEFIQRDGRFNLTEGLNNSFRYTCREGVQRYRTFGRRGLRYLWLVFRRLSGPVRIRFVRCLMSTYPQAGQGSFACSDPLLEQIWRAGARSVRCCSEDTYTDCPTYEQTHWVGDARNEALVDLIVNGDGRLSRHCLIQAARSLERSRLVESHVPSSWQNILPAWSFLWMRWAQEHFLLTGDRPLARRLMSYLDRQVRNLRGYLGPQGLIKIVGWNMFDWAPMDTPSGGTVTHLNCLGILGLRQAADLAGSIGDSQRASRWRRTANELADAANLHLWSDTRRAYVDSIHPDGKVSQVFSQQTQTAAYISGVASGQRARRCLRIAQKAPPGFVTAGSPFYMFFQLECLAQRGRWTELVQAIRDYWGVQIQAGATTFWETYAPQQERKTRSHCHGWSAAPTFFLSHYVLGVQPAEPGYAVVRVAPQPAGLRWAAGQVPTPRGPVQCAWQIGPVGPLAPGKPGWTLQLALPDARTEVRVELPARGKLTVLEGTVRRAGRQGGLLKLRCLGLRIRLHVGK